MEEVNLKPTKSKKAVDRGAHTSFCLIWRPPVPRGSQGGIITLTSHSEELPCTGHTADVPGAGATAQILSGPLPHHSLSPGTSAFRPAEVRLHQGECRRPRVRVKQEHRQESHSRAAPPRHGRWLRHVKPGDQHILLLQGSLSLPHALLLLPHPQHPGFTLPRKQTSQRPLSLSQTFTSNSIMAPVTLYFLASPSQTVASEREHAGPGHLYMCSHSDCHITGSEGLWPTGKDCQKHSLT